MKLRLPLTFIGSKNLWRHEKRMDKADKWLIGSYIIEVPQYFDVEITARGA